MIPLTLTVIESLRIAIAEECGWVVDASCPTWFEHGWHRPTAEHTDDCTPVPNYTTSLDAIQAAAMERFKKEECVRTFAAMLRQPYRASVKDYIWQLSALDWCIAFARTAKIWRYKI